MSSEDDALRRVAPVGLVASTGEPRDTVSGLTRDVLVPMPMSVEDGSLTPLG